MNSEFPNAAARLMVLIAGVLLIAATSARAATTVNLSTDIATGNVKRMGINLGFHTYYDSRLIMKELAFRNPGFEGQLYQSVTRVATGSPTNVVDDLAFGGWTNGFWDGATYEFIWGAAKGRAGTIASYLRPPNQTNGSTYNFAENGVTPGAGDYFVLRKLWNDKPETGWNPSGTNFVITAELADLPANTLGKQALHVMSTNSPANFTLTSTTDVYPSNNFLLLNGNFRVKFRAKSLASAQPLTVVVRRSAIYLNTNVTLTTSWQDYSLDFAAAEVGSAPGGLQLQFSLFTSFNALFDDVSFTQIDSDPANPTAYRDAVVNALKAYRPGILRGWQEIQGESLDNQLQPLLARRRAGFSIYSMTQANIQYGWHEYLELCEHIGAEPWIVMPIVFSTQEITNLVEYLTGPTNTVYGARRAARGHSAPWSDVFPKIHLEFGNEAWNGFTYFGGTIVQSVPYGNRANELFGAARAATGFVSNKFDLVLGGHAPETFRNLNIHNACTNHDSLTLDGYFFSRVDSFANNEEFYGPLFAQPEQFNRIDYMWQNYSNLQASSRPVPISVYEGNLNTTTGASMTNSQSALDTFTASLGVGLAVGNDMLMKLRDLKMRDQCLFSLGGYTTTLGSGSRIWGVTRDMGVTGRKRPQFLALQMVNEAIGDGANVLQTTHAGDNPTWSQTGVNNVTLTNAHFLWSYSLVTASNRSLVLFNLERTNALNVNFAGANLPEGSVTLKRLTSSAITNNNEFTQLVALTTNVLADFQANTNLTLPPFSMTVLTWQTLAPIEQWRQSNFGSTLNAGTSANDADPDGDGLRNLLEYALGANPTNTTSGVQPSYLFTTASGLTYLALDVTRAAIAPDVSYIVEVSPDLAQWFSGPAYTTELTNTSTLLRVRDNTPISAAPQRFMRLKITQP